MGELASHAGKRSALPPRRGVGTTRWNQAKKHLVFCEKVRLCMAGAGPLARKERA